jgi:hypothetical protein
MTEPVTRTPFCTKVRYGVTGAPAIPGGQGSYAPGITIEPTWIELVYSPARNGKPATVAAAVTGWYMRDGERVQPEGAVLSHYFNGPDGWPAWLAAEARLHDPNTVAERIRVDALKAAGVQYEDCPTCRAARPVGEDCDNCAFKARMDAELDARGL